MEFVNDTALVARFDYYDLDNNQQQINVNPGGSTIVNEITLPSNIAVSLWQGGQEQYHTLHGSLEVDSTIAGVIRGNDGNPVLDIA